MSEYLILAIALLSGIGAFILIMKKYGSECMP